MPEYTATLKGKDDDGRYTERVTVEAPDKKTARKMIEAGLLKGERIVFLTEGGGGTPIRTVDG